MSKNEYRRAFVMLRPAESGYSGHVRLERRTMTGTLYFIVNAPAAGALNAALVGQRGGEYYAAPLGALRADSRGQLTLAYSFDPRNIDGRPLEAYQLLAVADTGRDGCAVVLTGNVDGAYPMDAAAVREAVCALFEADTPAADLPAPDELLPGADAAPASAPPPEAVPVNADISGAIEAEHAEAAEKPSDDQAESAAEKPSGAACAEDAGSASGAGKAHIFTRLCVSAGAEDAEATEKPEAADARRALEEADAASPCTMPLEDGYAYVRVPLPAACGFGYAMIGVRADDGRVESVRVALPGAYAAQPPEGLENSVWLGAGDGGGYWVSTVRCRRSVLDWDD